jgi:hypothetical protein
MLSGTAFPIHGLASNGGRILESGRKQWRILPGKRGLSGTSRSPDRAESASFKFAMSAASFLRKERIGQLFSK